MPFNMSACVVVECTVAGCHALGGDGDNPVVHFGSEAEAIRFLVGEMGWTLCRGGRMVCDRTWLRSHVAAISAWGVERAPGTSGDAMVAGPSTSAAA